MAKKVLIIDDSAQDAFIVSEAFKQADFGVFVISRPLEAHAAVYDIAPDLIILDVLMSDMGGYELCRLLKADEMTKQIPVIIHTALNKNIDKFWAYRSGANGFVSKSRPVDELITNALKAVQSFPVSQEYKSRLIGSKKDLRPHLPDKKRLLDSLRNISEINADASELAIKLFRIISSVFRYDMAMICFNDSSSDKKLLLFDTGELKVGQNVFKYIKNIVSPREDALFRVVSKKDEKEEISNIDEFNIRYEFETDVDTKPAGWLFLYVKDKINSTELKLVSSIKTETEHIIRTRFLQNIDRSSINCTDAKKMYTSFDFDKIINHEISWHKRNNMPLALINIEINSFESIKNQIGEEYCDVILAKLSNILTKCLSEGEFICRNEDGIFTILMTNTDYNRMCDALEYIKSSVEDPLLNDFDIDENIKINIGAIMYNENHKNHYEFIDAAYDALDDARRTKNGIITKV